MATLKRIGALTPDVAKAAAERIKELEKQKAELQHGEWLAMVEKRLPGSHESRPTCDKDPDTGLLWPSERGAAAVKKARRLGGKTACYLAC